MTSVGNIPMFLFRCKHPAVYSMTDILSLITKQPMSRFIIAVLHPKTEGIKLRPLQPLPMDAFIIP